jgi:hypothetical protein
MHVGFKAAAFAPSYPFALLCKVHPSLLVSPEGNPQHQPVSLRLRKVGSLTHAQPHSFSTSHRHTVTQPWPCTPSPLYSDRVCGRW